MSDPRRTLPAVDALLQRSRVDNAGQPGVQRLRNRGVLLRIRLDA